MGKFLMTSKKSKEAVEKALTRGGFSNFKIEKKITRLLILGPISEDRSAVFSSTVHEMFAGGKFIAKAASPAFTGEKDKISDLGWNLRDKFEKSTNIKKKELWRAFMPSRKYYVNVLDLDNVEAGPQVYSMSGVVSELVMDEIKELGDDLSSICDFDEGRILKITSNMKPKLKRKYKAEFLDETANLIEDGILDDEGIDELAEKLHDLEKQQPAFNEDAFEKYLGILRKKASALGVDIDDLIEDEDPEDIEEVDEEEVDEDDDLVDDDEEEEIDDDEIDDDEFDEEEEDELEEEEEEPEPEPVRKKKKVKKKASKVAKKKVKKKVRRRA